VPPPPGLSATAEALAQQLAEAHQTALFLYRGACDWDNAHPQDDLTEASPSSIAATLVTLLGEAHGRLGVLRDCIAEAEPAPGAEAVPAENGA
jgi:hypothetical protein